MLRLDILDNTDHIGLVEGRTTANEAHIRFSLSKLSSIIIGYFSTTNRRVDENKAYIVANENAIAENHDTIALNQNAITENHDAIALNQNAIAENHDAIALNQNATTENHDTIAENKKAIVGYSTIIELTLPLKI